MAVMTAEKIHHCSSKKVPIKKLVRVLLDSGSDGDLLFHKKGVDKHFPYLTRQVPKSWCMSNGEGPAPTELLSVQQQQDDENPARCC